MSLPFFRRHPASATFGHGAADIPLQEWPQDGGAHQSAPPYPLDSPLQQWPQHDGAHPPTALPPDNPPPRGFRNRPRGFWNRDTRRLLAAVVSSMIAALTITAVSWVWVHRGPTSQVRAGFTPPPIGPRAAQRSMDLEQLDRLPYEVSRVRAMKEGWIDGAEA